MANKKMSALALIAGAAISATDFGPLVDADAVTPTTYKATMAEQRSALLKAPGAGWDATDYLTLGGGTPPASGMVRSAQGAIVADSPLINSTATWNAGGVTFRHVLVNITDTASAVGSLFADFQIGGVSKWKVDKLGNETLAGGLAATTGAFSGNVTSSASFIAGIGGGFAVTGRSGIFSGADGLLVLTNNAGTDFARLQLGGTSASFPGLRRNGAQLEIVTADGTAWTTLAAGSLTAVTGGITVTAGGANITGNSVVVGTLSGISTLSANSVGISGANNQYQFNDRTTNSESHILYADAHVGRVWLGSVGDILKWTYSTGVLTSVYGVVISAGGLAVTGNSTITGTLGGITTLTATTLAGTLSTAAQPNITSVGVLASLHMTGPTVDSGDLTLTNGALRNASWVEFNGAVGAPTALGFGGGVATSASAGSNGAPPAQVYAYWIGKHAGTNVRVPMYLA